MQPLIEARLPYLVLAPLSFVAYNCLSNAWANNMPGGNFVHSTGLFFFQGVLNSDCSDFTTRKTYFLLHTTMAMLLSVICLANRRGFNRKGFSFLASTAVVKRIFFFSWAYLAVGIAIPLQFLVSGDVGLFRPWHENDETWKPSALVIDPALLNDADYMTWCEILIAGGWILLASFPRTTCAAEYGVVQETSFFDHGVIAWAALCIVPLLLYKWRPLLPSIWKLLGRETAAEKYRGLAFGNLVITLLFFLYEAYFAKKYGLSNAGWLSTLHHVQQVQYFWNWSAAVLDYIFTAITLAVLVYRADQDRSVLMSLLTLVLPNVGLPYFLGKHHSMRGHQD